MLLKTILAHVVISIISIFGLLWLLAYLELESDIVYITTFIIILFLYFLSGYIITNSKTKWYNYFSVAYAGIILWLYAFAFTPDSLNWKKSVEAGNWLYYRVYIAGIESPLNFIEGFNIAENYSARLEIYFIGLLPVVASVLQYLGGLYKLQKLAARRNEKKPDRNIHRLLGNSKDFHIERLLDNPEVNKIYYEENVTNIYLVLLTLYKAESIPLIRRAITTSDVNTLKKLRANIPYDYDNVDYDVIEVYEMVDAATNVYHVICVKDGKTSTLKAEGVLFGNKQLIPLLDSYTIVQ